jgi:hypothetical protein
MFTSKQIATAAFILASGLAVASGAAKAGTIQVSGDMITRVVNLESTPTAIDGADPILNAATTYSDSASITGIGTANASATIAASTAAGALKASVSSVHSLDGTAGYSEASVNVTVADFITIGQGSGLAVGTPDTITLTMSLSGTHSAIDNSSGGGYGMDITASETVTDEVKGTQTSITFDVAFGSGNLTGTFAGVVGENVILDSTLNVFSYAAGDNDPYGTSTIDYSHTVNYYLDASDPGTDLIGSTDHDYSTPLASSTSVPEPSSLAGMIFPLAVLGVMSLSKWRRRELRQRFDRPS